jgi:hypothetical protein
MTVFIEKGDAPLTPVQLEKRAQGYIKRSWPDQEREKSIRTADGLFDAFMVTFSADHDVNVANNTFNHQLHAYRKATARLDQYKVAEGRPEITEEQPTGQYDEEGNEITETVVVQTAIDPVEPTVEQPVYDEEGNQIGTETVTNPLIVADEAERAEAQAVIDATPQEVKDFD